MTKKEKLLQKGFTEAEADEFLSAEPSDGVTIDNPLQALNKALEIEVLPDGELPLHKADKDEEDDDNGKEKYDPDYMKKHMKKFMSENKKMCSKMAEDLDMGQEKMNKAFDGIDPDGDGVVVEMADFSEYGKTQNELMATMAKAIAGIQDTMEVMLGQEATTYDLMHKAAVLQAETSGNLQKAMSLSAGRKGAVVVEADLKKALPVVLDGKVIWANLTKAIGDGDKKAGPLMTKFESNGLNPAVFNAAEQAYITEIGGAQ